MGVHRVGPTQVFVESEGDERHAYQGSAIGVEVRAHQVVFEPQEEVGPGEVGVGEKKSIPASRPARSDGPGIGSGQVLAFLAI